MFCSVKTLPRVERSSFFMSSRRIPETSPGDARYHFEPRLAWRLRLLAQRAEMLNPCHLVAGCTVVLGKLRLDDDLRVELIRNHEIGRLVEAG